MSDVFLTVQKPCVDAIAWVVRQCSTADLQVMQTFDLQAARYAHTGCLCPHHGSDQCDCQLVVLLIYADHSQPISLVAHSSDGNTWLSLVDTPQQRADPHLEAAIRRALVAQSPPPRDYKHCSHAI